MKNNLSLKRYKHKFHTNPTRIIMEKENHIEREKVRDKDKVRPTKTTRKKQRQNHIKTKPISACKPPPNHHVHTWHFHSITTSLPLTSHKLMFPTRILSARDSLFTLIRFAISVSQHKYTHNNTLFFFFR